MLFIDIIRALKKGKEIANPKAWKDTASITNGIVIILGAVVGLLRFFSVVDLPVTDEWLGLVAVSLSGLVSAYNMLVTAISSKKVGI